MFFVVVLLQLIAFVSRLGGLKQAHEVGSWSLEGMML
jgi:hypothetical protein